MTGKAHAQRLEIEHHGTHDPGEKCFKKEMATKPNSSKTSPDQAECYSLRISIGKGVEGAGVERHIWQGIQIISEIQLW